MDKEKSAVEQFLGDLNDNTVDNPFGKETDDPFQVPEEALDVKEEVKEEKPLPFNKDPKVQKFIEKEISKRMEAFNVEDKPVVKPQEDDEVSDVLVRLIGNDTPEKVQMVKEFKNILEKGTQRAKAEALAEIEARERAEIEADKQAEEELENAFDNIEETYDVDLTSNNPLAVKTRQEFVSFVERIAPKDRNGNVVDYPDMTSAWETFSEMKKATSTPSRAKELASRGMARSAEASSKPQERVDWNTVDSFLETLGK